MKSQWRMISSDPELIRSLTDSLNCHPVTATVLANRNIRSRQAAMHFLSPSLAHIRSPFSLKDMDRAVSRIVSAIVNKERILIFGDYDADGITATALLVDFFQYIGADASFYIPHRMTEGYGLKSRHITDVALPRQVGLIITVDCGSNSHEAVLKATQAGIDVIITDHHNIAAPIPDAIAVVNPKRSDCHSGLEHLAGVGIAFFLLICLRKGLRDISFWKGIPEPNLKRCCDLVAIGTVADIVPIVDENRVLTRAGLEIMTQGYRPGANALIEASGIRDGYIDSDDIAFRLAPRINAAGRIDNAGKAVELLLAPERESASPIALFLNQLNSKRQEIENKTFSDILMHISGKPLLSERKTMVLFYDNWHEGILGIVASRLVKKFFRPTVLITLQNGSARGSGRSIPGFDLHDGLMQCADTLESFGGHAMAAGLSIKPEKIPEFREKFEAVVRNAGIDEQNARLIEMDCELRFNMITDKLMDELEELKPFGTGNTEPLFLANRIRVVQSLIIGGNHRKMVLKQNNDAAGKVFQAIQFNIDADKSPEKEFEEIIFHLRWNRWNGNKTVQLIIEDAVPGTS